MKINIGRYWYGVLVLFCGLISSQLLAQGSSFDASGYTSCMPSYQYTKLPNSITQFGFKVDQHVWDMLLHNRLNFDWQINGSLSAKLEVRNRLFFGETISNTPNYGSNFDADAGWLDGSINIENRSNYVLNTQIDRFYLDYSKDKLQITVGRQRINWGQAMAWNPNDVFNAYSYFDFDYIEKPGIDGFRFQYYTGVTSKLEVVGKIDYLNQLSLAALYRLNTLGYDVQFLGGMINDNDWFVGLGWSGDIKGAGFYGEVTSYYETIQKNDGVSINGNLGSLNLREEYTYEVVGVVGANYTFKNSLMLQGEWLYCSSQPNDISLSSIFFFNKETSFKNLSITKQSAFVSLGYALTPLITTNASLMSFVGTESWYAGPSFDFSLSDNITFSVIGQYITLKLNNSSRVNMLACFARLKWSF